MKFCVTKATHADPRSVQLLDACLSGTAIALLVASNGSKSPNLPGGAGMLLFEHNCVTATFGTLAAPPLPTLAAPATQDQNDDSAELEHPGEFNLPDPGGTDAQPPYGSDDELEYVDLDGDGTEV